MSKSIGEKRLMIEPDHAKLSIICQCALVGLHRSLYYYEPAQESVENLALMAQIDKQYLKCPFYGTRRMTALLQNMGYEVNRKRVQRLYKLMGLEGIGPKPNLSKPGKGHKIYPYLLKGFKIERVNQVWATDLTYMPMPTGFMYLMAVIDHYSRKVIAWGVSNSMDTDFCSSVLQAALAYGKPDIFNTDQGSQFTSEVFTSILLGEDIKVSMDGKGRAIDNIFVERLWRSVKYEYLYLQRPETCQELYQGLQHYFQFYNYERLHQSLGYQPPEVVYRSDTA
jgi:putative transposase